MANQTDPPSGANSWTLTGYLDDRMIAQSVSINRFPFNVGRLSTNDLCLGFGHVSKHHAQFVLTDDVLSVRDCGSTNGTYINGSRIEENTTVQLKHRDTINFSDQEFVVQEVIERNFRQTCVSDGAAAGTIRSFFNLLHDRSVVPHFHSIVDFSDNSVLGAEVLARSGVPGLQTAPQLFKLAEQLDWSQELSEMMREEGVRRALAQNFRGSLFVNIHSSEMCDTDRLLNSLNAMKKVAGDMNIVVELHEQTVVEADSMHMLRRELRSSGIELAYDDFGSGQARLLELAEVPPDYLKFDISFIRGLHKASASRQRMVESLVQMVLELGIKPLAEGIECAEDAEICRRMQFQYAQGFYYGFPAPKVSCFHIATQSLSATLSD